MLRHISFETMSATKFSANCNNGEIVARREAVRSQVGNLASTATNHGGDARHCCFEIYVSEH